MLKRGLHLAGVGILVTLLGCNSPDQDPTRQAKAQSADTLLHNALAQLREQKPSLGGFRNAVQQLNVYLDSPEAANEKELKPLDPDARKVLIEQLLRVPDSARLLKEVEGRSFSVVDASHIDSCFLFRDAARTLLNDLGPPPAKNDEAAWRRYNLQLADYFFDWSMRQVDLAPRPLGGDPWPAHDILRRGTGDAEERLRVFLALMEQVNLFLAEERRLAEIQAQLAAGDERGAGQLKEEQAELQKTIQRFKPAAAALMRTVDYQDDDGSRKTRAVPWAAAVLIDGELYLFEPRLGRPVPGPGGSGIATWKQARQNPALLQELYRGDADPVTPAQLEKAELHLAFSLPALAPRMAWLESKFEVEGVRLHENPPARVAHFQSAGLDLPIRVWTRQGAPGYPLVLLHQFVENTNQERRLRDLIVPRYLLPQWVREMYAQLGSARDQARLTADFDMLFLRLRVEPGGVRDLLVRGRSEEAIQKLLQFEDLIDKAMDYNARDVNIVPSLRQGWAPQVVERSRRIRDLSLQMRAAPDDQRDAIFKQIASEASHLERLWRDKQAALSELAILWAVPEFRAHLTYFMAMAKIDLARRAEIQMFRQGAEAWPPYKLRPRQLWVSAEEWLVRYQAIMLPLGVDPWQAAAERYLSLCRQKLATYAAKDSPAP